MNNSQKKVLILLTAWFPFRKRGAAEVNFLVPEIDELSSRFDHILILPEKTTTEKVAVPENCSCDNSLAQEVYAKKISVIIKTAVRGLFSNLFWSDLFRVPKLLFYVPTLLLTIMTIGRAEAASDLIGKIIRKRGCAPEQIVVYSYWLSGGAICGALCKKKIGTKAVSRAHRGDLYADLYPPLNYLPCRKFIFDFLDYTIPISLHGQKYILSEYGVSSDRVVVFRLAVEAQALKNQPSADGIFRIVSCSEANERKRVALILDAFSEFARSSPDLQIEWTHIGDGPSLPAIRAHVSTIAPENLRCVLRGPLVREEILAFYLENPVDLFITLSSDEGIPVSIMEAISFGIPVFATSVGGIPESVNSENGWLVPVSWGSEQLASYLKQIGLPNENHRRASLSMWAETYNAAKNHSEFSDFLCKLINHAV